MNTLLILILSIFTFVLSEYLLILVHFYYQRRKLLKNVNWVSVKDKLPEEGKYVLGWYSPKHVDQANANCVVVKLKKGISLEERKLMKEGKLPSKKITGRIRMWGQLIPFEEDRCDFYEDSDEGGKNHVPYIWKERNGINPTPGQDITHWSQIEPPL